MSADVFVCAHLNNTETFILKRKYSAVGFFRCLQSLTLLLYMYWSCVRLKHCYGSHRALFYRFISWPACHRIHKDIYIMVALIGILNCASLGATGRCWNLSFSDIFFCLSSLAWGKGPLLNLQLYFCKSHTEITVKQVYRQASHSH